MAKVVKGVDPESKYFFFYIAKQDKKLKADLDEKKTTKKKGAVKGTKKKK